MGGAGSGRTQQWNSTNTTDDYLSIDIRRWTRLGLLSPVQDFGWRWTISDQAVASIFVRVEYDRVTLMYRHRCGGSDWQEMCHPIYIDWTSCHIGGRRSWFLCPNATCSCRTAILYLGNIFACRACNQLTYPCQRENELFRKTRHLIKVRNNLGGDNDLFFGKRPERPKGMHHNTYKILLNEHDNKVEALRSELFARL